MAHDDERTHLGREHAAPPESGLAAHAATEAAQLARFVTRAGWEDLSLGARRELKVRVLDSVGCAIGALAGEPMRLLRDHLETFGGEALSTLVAGNHIAPDRAAFYNGALVRYLGFNDNYLAPGETSHPSDNLGAVLAACQHAGGTGRDLLTALAVAYQVQCRLCDVAPVHDRGFDHATQGALAAAAGTAKALGLGEEQTAQAVAIAGTAYNALRVTRTGSPSHWIALAMPNAARCALHAAYLARAGITGPAEAFEGDAGWRSAVSGDWTLDWSREDLERVTRTVLKKYNADVHAQSAVEGALELMREHGLSPSDIDGVEIDIFQAGYDLIGGGEGDKTRVGTRHEAGHSLPYIVAVAILDGDVYPEQYRPERIEAADVQSLLRRVVVRPDDGLTRRFPDEHACRVTLVTANGRKLRKEKRDYEGWHTRPMSWDAAEGKFRRLAEPFADGHLIEEIAAACRALDEIHVRDLTMLLARVRQPGSLGSPPNASPASPRDA